MKNKYENIIDYIESLIEKKKLSQGQRLPSIRYLANEFGFSKSTIIRAYNELEANHKIYSIPKGGYYLVEKLDIETQDYDSINFLDAVPDPRLLPYKEFNHCINRAVEQYKNKIFTYIESQGLESLRKSLAGHFQESQIFTSQENIFITSGAQQALSILCSISFPNGKKSILVEQPTYNLMQRLAELNDIKLVGIERTENGLDFKELERIFKEEDIKFFYTIPRLHNPLGVSYSEKEKRKIAELAGKYDVYIVEDDYLADIDINKKAQSIYYYDISNKVIYVKSYSKAFMPGIRIGAVVLHKNLIEEFAKLKRYNDLNTSVVAQGALEIFINSGMYKNHCKKVRKAYKKKMDVVKLIFASMESGLRHKMEVYVPETGFFLWIKLPDEINADFFIEKLKSKKVFVSSAKEYFIKRDTKENCFRISISKLTDEEIKSGLMILIKELADINI